MILNSRSDDYKGKSVLERLAMAGLALVAVAAVTGCGSGTGSKAAAHPTGKVTAKVKVVAAENWWGSIASQLGGDRTDVVSIITNPNADPHDYEASTGDGRTFAQAQLVIVNGAGYDPWAQKLLDAAPVNGRTVLDIGKLVGVKEGGNPHRWYSPTDVRATVDAITAALKQLQPATASVFDANRSSFLTSGLGQYDTVRSQIRSQYAGVSVGATESIFEPLAQDLGVALLTPEPFLNAVSEGNEPTAADKATFDRQITQREIKVLVFNSQNATPDVQALVDKARAEGIPVVSITETLSPPTVTFQEWQTAQLQQLALALHQATGH